MTEGEFKMFKTGYKRLSTPKESVQKVSDFQAAPNSIDWRANNAVNPPKNQG